MRSHTAFIIAALAAAVNAVQFTNNVIDPEPGKPFELSWSGAQGSVTINLKTGPSTNLRTVKELESGLTGESIIITLDPADYPSGTYAFEIVDSEDPKPNYSEQFTFQGTGELPTPSATDSPLTSSAASRSSSEMAVVSKDPSTGSETSSSTSSSRPSPTVVDDEEEETSVPGAAGRLASPLALIMVTVAAMAYFN